MTMCLPKTTLVNLLLLCFQMTHSRIFSVCDDMPCLNGGRCVDLSENNGLRKFECACLTGYKGLTCQQRIDPCESEPCMHGGSCNPVGEKYHCVCRERFSGPNCEDRVKRPASLCETEPCAPHGTCEVVNEDYVCNCYEGYTGPRCRQAIHSMGVVAVEADEAQHAIRDVLIALLVILLVIIVIGVSCCVHCLRILSARAKEKMINEERMLHGQRPLPPAGWLDVSNRLCYNFWYCKSSDSAQTTEHKAMMSTLGRTGTPSVGAGLGGTASVSAGLTGAGLTSAGLTGTGGTINVGDQVFELVPPGVTLPVPGSVVLNMADFRSLFMTAPEDAGRNSNFPNFKGSTDISSRRTLVPDTKPWKANITDTQSQSRTGSKSVSSHHSDEARKSVHSEIDRQKSTLPDDTDETRRESSIFNARKSTKASELFTSEEIDVTGRESTVHGRKSSRLTTKDDKTGNRQRGSMNCSVASVNNKSSNNMSPDKNGKRKSTDKARSDKSESNNQRRKESCMKSPDDKNKNWSGRLEEPDEAQLSDSQHSSVNETEEEYPEDDGYSSTTETHHRRHHGQTRTRNRLDHEDSQSCRHDIKTTSQPDERRKHKNTRESNLTQRRATIEQRLKRSRVEYQNNQGHSTKVNKHETEPKQFKGILKKPLNDGRHVSRMQLNSPSNNNTNRKHTRSNYISKPHNRSNLMARGNIFQGETRPEISEPSVVPRYQDAVDQCMRLSTSNPRGQAFHQTPKNPFLQQNAARGFHPRYSTTNFHNPRHNYNAQLIKRGYNWHGNSYIRHVNPYSNVPPSYPPPSYQPIMS